jgi:hypothetical protein
MEAEEHIRKQSFSIVLHARTAMERYNLGSNPPYQTEVNLTIRLCTARDSSVFSEILTCEIFK